jgi:hypothetical protein
MFNVEWESPFSEVLTHVLKHFFLLNKLCSKGLRQPSNIFEMFLFEFPCYSHG